MIKSSVKTQYYPEDLSKLLNLGDIITMYVCDDGRGTEVLRVMSNPVEPSEFKTVRATGKAPKKPVKKPPREPRREMPALEDPMVVDPADRKDRKREFGKKIVNVAKDWLSKPMKRPDEW